MFEFIWNKIKNQKVLNICLLMGVSLFISLFTCHPMFEKGAENQLLQTLFTEYANQNNSYPAVIKREGEYKCIEYDNSDDVLEQINKYESKWTEYIDTDIVAAQRYLSVPGGRSDTDLGGEDEYFSIGYLPDIDEKTVAVRGRNLSEAAKNTVDDIYPCCINEKTMDAYGLVAGEKLNMHFSQDGVKKVLTFEVVGIVREKDINDSYWQTGLKEFDKTIFVNKDVMDKLMDGYGQNTVKFTDSLMLDYRQINVSNAAKYKDYLSQFKENDSLYSDNFSETLEKFMEQQRTIKQILWALELPCLVLLLLFIRMISSQILDIEESDMAALRSRGATRRQIMYVYGVSSSLIAAAGTIVGIIVGFLMCKVAASTDGFLKFVRKDSSLYQFTPLMCAYAFAAAVIMILFMTIPVWKHSIHTVISHKAAENITLKKPLWEKLFLDIILILISGYLLYNYYKQQETLSISVLENKGVDPVMLLDTSLFIFAFGLLFIRVFRYIVIAIDRLLKKYESPALYASFLQIKRTWYKQGFLAIFLIMTVAGGIFDANMARTMNNNMDERIKYDVGCDLRTQEKFKIHIRKSDDGTVAWRYDEPDTDKYRTLVDTGECEYVTKVIKDDRVDVEVTSKKVNGVLLMGINTKEFGQTADLKDGLNDKHWFYALNALGQEPNGVIISANLADDLGVGVDDTINYTRYKPAETGVDQKEGTVTVKICAIVDAFPGYDRYSYEKDEDGNVTEREKYLIVGNYAAIVDNFGLTPYEMWMRRGGNGSDNETILKQIDVTDKVSARQLISENRNSAIVQITNGMFTLSFILSLIVCAAGFLLYWIMALKRRELMFGIYRAMGVRMSEIKKMLLVEQIFASVLPILSGAAAGAICTGLFVRLISVIYLPKKHNIDIGIYVYASDLAELVIVLGTVMLGCYVIIIKLLRKMKIAQALRLGED